MANNKSFQPGYRMSVVPTAPVAPVSGGFARYGMATGICLNDADAAGVVTVDFGPAVWSLEVTETAGVQIDPGDPVFLDVDGAVLTNNADDWFFGYAMGTVGLGATATIDVAHVAAPGAGAIGAGTVGTAALAPGALAAGVAGRAIVAADFFDEATLADKVEDDAITEAVLLDKVNTDAFTEAALADVIEDDAFTLAVVGDKFDSESIAQDHLVESSLTGYAPGVVAADSDVGAVPIVLRYDVPDGANADLDFDLEYDVLPLDIWLKKAGAGSSAHGGNHIQVQTVGGAANITDQMSLNSVSEHVIVRAASVDGDAVTAGVGAIRIRREREGTEVGCEVYILAVKV